MTIRHIDPEFLTQDPEFSDAEWERIFALGVMEVQASNKGLVNTVTDVRRERDRLWRESWLYKMGLHLPFLKCGMGYEKTIPSYLNTRRVWYFDTFRWDEVLWEELGEDTQAFMRRLLALFYEIVVCQKEDGKEGIMLGYTDRGEAVILAEWAPKDHEPLLPHEMETIVEMRNRLNDYPTGISVVAVLISTLFALLIVLSTTHLSFTSGGQYTIGLIFLILISGTIILPYPLDRVWHWWLRRQFKEKNPKIAWAL